MATVFLPLVLLLSFAKQLLLKLGQDEKVANYTQMYITPMIPAMFFFGLFDLSRRFLTCLQYSTAPMVAQIISSICHVFLLMLFIWRWEMNVDGLGYATMLTYFSNFLFVTIYSHCITSIKPALFWPTRDTFHGWYAYLAIGIPSIVMLMAEGWAFQVMGIFSGLISVADQAVSGVMVTLIALMF